MDRNSAPKISVYIPVFNGEAYLRPCIDGLLKQNYQADEILIIDDGSTDRTAQIAQSYGNAVRLIQHPQNMGLSAARNTGLQNARNSLVACLDVDCVPSTGWLSVITYALLADPNIAGVGGNLFETNVDSPADQYRCKHMNQSWGDLGLKNPAFLFGANAIYRRDAIAKVGFYNTEFRTNGEDVDMCSRLKTAGYDLIYEPRAFAYHFRKDNLKSVLNMQWKHWRHPYVNYKPHESLKDVGSFLKIMLGFVAQNIKSDIQDKSYTRAGISVLSFFNIPFREIRLYFEEKQKRNQLKLATENRTLANAPE